MESGCGSGRVVRDENSTSAGACFNETGRPGADAAGKRGETWRRRRPRPKRSDTRANTRRIVTVSAATKASVAAVARKGGGEECGEGGEGGGWDEAAARSRD